MKNLIAAKLLIAGMSESARVRDGKTLSEIIKTIKPQASVAMITESDLVRVSDMSLKEISRSK